jgi:hypothetical protein
MDTNVEKSENLFSKIVRNKIFITFFSLVAFYYVTYWGSVVLLERQVRKEAKALRASASKAGVFISESRYGEPVRKRGRSADDYCKALAHIVTVPGELRHIRITREVYENNKQKVSELIESNREVYKLIKEAAKYPQSGTFYNNFSKNNRENCHDSYRFGNVTKVVVLKVYHDWEQGNRQESIDLTGSYLRLISLLSSSGSLKNGGWLQLTTSNSTIIAMLDGVNHILKENIKADYSGIITEIDNILANQENAVQYAFIGEMAIAGSSAEDIYKDYQNMMDWLINERYAQKKISPMYKIYEKQVYLLNVLNHLKSLRENELLVRENKPPVFTLSANPDNFHLLSNRLSDLFQGSITTNSVSIERLKETREKLINLDTSGKYHHSNKETGA